MRVLIGHGPESANLKEIQPLVERFYHAEENDQDRLALIHQFQIEYIFWGPAERSLGGWDPSQTAHLSLIDRQGDYSYYEVRK